MNNIFRKLLARWRRLTLIGEITLILIVKLIIIFIIWWLFFAGQKVEVTADSVLNAPALRAQTYLEEP